MKRVIQTSIRDVDYYGQQAAYKFGDKISENLSGMKISLNPRYTSGPGGVKFEAKHLGINPDKFKEALIGMCEDGRAVYLALDEYLVL